MNRFDSTVTLFPLNVLSNLERLRPKLLFEIPLMKKVNGFMLELAELNGTVNEYCTILFEVCFGLEIKNDSTWSKYLQVNYFCQCFLRSHMCYARVYHWQHESDWHRVQVAVTKLLTRPGEVRRSNLYGKNKRIVTKVSLGIRTRTCHAE